MNPDPNAPPTHDEITVCAYLIWEHEGRPEGRDLEVWLQAETQLTATQQHEQNDKTTTKQRAAGKPKQPAS